MRDGFKSLNGLPPNWFFIATNWPLRFAIWVHFYGIVVNTQQIKHDRHDSTYRKVCFPSLEQFSVNYTDVRWVMIWRADVSEVVKFIQTIRMNSFVFHVIFSKTEIMGNLLCYVIIGISIRFLLNTNIFFLNQHIFTFIGMHKHIDPRINTILSTIYILRFYDVLWF